MGLLGIKKPFVLGGTPQVHDTKSRLGRYKGVIRRSADLGPDERRAFLYARAPSLSVLAEVERLIAEHKQAGSFLSTPVVSGFTHESNPDRDHLRQDTVLAGRFKISRFIASGGMGDVYEADDLELRERVAIKTIRADVLQRPDAPGRLRREVHLARKVTHPNVCRIFDLFRHLDSVSRQPREVVFVSMELLNGQTLAERLRSKGRMTTAEALPLIEQICAALSAAHNAGVIHRDLKPGNIVLMEPERKEGLVRAVVTDFGLAARVIGEGLDSSMTTQSMERDFSGTPAYMAPEQVEGHPVTESSDIYSLGLVVYEMITGVVPFQGENALSTALKRLKELPDPPRKLVPELNPAWDKAILRCLERDPAARFARPYDFYSALVDSDRTHSVGNFTLEKQERILEAAAPKEATVGRSLEVVSMVRRVDSKGLRKLLTDEALPFLKPDDVRGRPFELEFPLDRTRTAQPVEIHLRLESPDFEPPCQTKKLRVPPLGDSAPCTFLIRPRVVGDLVVNLELLRGDEVVVSRQIRTRALPEGQPITAGKTILSIPLTIVVQPATLYVMAAEVFDGPAAPTPNVEPGLTVTSPIDVKFGVKGLPDNDAHTANEPLWLADDATATMAWTTTSLDKLTKRSEDDLPGASPSILSETSPNSKIGGLSTRGWQRSLTVFGGAIVVVALTSTFILWPKSKRRVATNTPNETRAVQAPAVQALDRASRSPFSPLLQPMILKPPTQSLRSSSWFARNSWSVSVPTIRTGCATCAPMRPAVLISPMNGFRAAPTNTRVRVTFIEGSVPAFVRFTKEGILVHARCSILEGTSSIQIVPNEPLEPNSTYGVAVYNYSMSKDGTTTINRGVESTFTTSTQSLKTPPQVMSVNLDDGQENVATSTKVIVEFTSPMDGQSFFQTGTQGFALLDSARKTVPSEIRLSDNLKAAILLPTHELAGNARYVVVAGKALTDLAGNPLGHLAIRSFSTRGNNYPK